jgi:hypothetical protein
MSAPALLLALSLHYLRVAPWQLSGIRLEEDT